MKTLLELSRVMLQKTGPSVKGSVLGRYSVPLLRLNSCKSEQNEHRSLLGIYAYLLDIIACGHVDLGCAVMNYEYAKELTGRDAYSKLIKLGV